VRSSPTVDIFSKGWLSNWTNYWRSLEVLQYFLCKGIACAWRRKGTFQDLVKGSTTNSKFSKNLPNGHLKTWCCVGLCEMPASLCQTSKLQCWSGGAVASNIASCRFINNREWSMTGDLSQGKSDLFCSYFNLLTAAYLLPQPFPVLARGLDLGFNELSQPCIPTIRILFELSILMGSHCYIPLKLLHW